MTTLQEGLLGLFKGNKAIHEDEAFVVPKEDEEQIYEDCDNNITQNLSDDESSIALGTDVYVFDKGIIGCHIKDDTINLKFCDGPKENSIVGIIGEYTQEPEEDTSLTEGVGLLPKESQKNNIPTTVGPCPEQSNGRLNAMNFEGSPKFDDRDSYDCDTPT